MEKGKRIQAINDEFPLPEAIIQHIQSFLNGNEAARTSILSKSWYNAWLTRPNIDLDESNFGNPSYVYGYTTLGVVNDFWEFAKKTMQRYVELSLKIESLRLCAQSDSSRNVNELILKAVKMGVNDLSVYRRAARLVLPREVLESENLIKLSLSEFTIDRWVGGKVNCRRLKSLSLRRMCIGNDIAWDIISSCPLIEKLLISECKCYLGVKPKVSRIWTWGPSIESVVRGPIQVFEFQKLNCLLLERANLDASFFHDFPAKFPSLEDLTLRDCRGYGSVKMSSRSLKYISIEQKSTLRGTFDVPSISRFSVSVSSIPFVSGGMGMVSREWESNVSIRCCQHRVSAKWFLRLKKLLTTLSTSKISISIVFVEANRFDYVGEAKDLPIPAVENLTVSMNSSSSSSSSGPALLNGLFLCCHPKVITRYWLDRQQLGDNTFLELLCKSLIQEVSQNCYIPNPNVYRLRNLKEVNVEVFDETHAEWWPLPWKTLLNHSTNLQKLRFQLKWGTPDHSGGR